MLEASDVFSAAEVEGQTDPYIILSRLKTICGIPDERARYLLFSRGFVLDDSVIDARVDTVSCSRQGGFGSKL